MLQKPAKGMKSRFGVPGCLLLLLLTPVDAARAQTPPSATELDRMILQLNQDDVGVVASLERSPEFEGLFGLSYDAGSRTDEVCGMQHFSLRLTNDHTGKSNVFGVLLDRQAGKASIVPRQLLALTSVLHVDADGSPRAYHPEDPAGKGTCQFKRLSNGAYSAEGVCALDRFSSGGIKLFKGGRKLSDFELGEDWKQFWLRIRNKDAHPLDFNKSATVKTKNEYYSFSLAERNLIVFFKKGIIPPTQDGYPCTYSNKAQFPGYFVSATTLTNSQDQKNSDEPDPFLVAPSECNASRYVNGERVPFFVLPGGHIGDVKVGDIVVAHAKIREAERTVYGIIGDAGPTQSFGEASIALIQGLLGKHDELVMNSSKLDELDIGIDAKITVSILILGDTKELLHGNYTRENIEAVGREEFKRWAGDNDDPTRRLNSCIAQAKNNPR